MTEKPKLVDLNMKVQAEHKQRLYEISNARTKKEGKRISIASVAREVFDIGFKNFKK